jgi:hypothetical protein
MRKHRPVGAPTRGHAQIFWEIGGNLKKKSRQCEGVEGVRKKKTEVHLAPRPRATHSYQGVNGKVLYGHVKVAAKFEDFRTERCLVKKKSRTWGHKTRSRLAKLRCMPHRASIKINQHPSAQTPSHGCSIMRPRSNLLGDWWKFKKKV